MLNKCFILLTLKGILKCTYSYGGWIGSDIITVGGLMEEERKKCVRCLLSQVACGTGLFTLSHTFLRCTSLSKLHDDSDITSIRIHLFQEGLGIRIFQRNSNE